jgi:hypothetical protein
LDVNLVKVETLFCKSPTLSVKLSSFSAEVSTALSKALAIIEAPKAPPTAPPSAPPPTPAQEAPFAPREP